MQHPNENMVVVTGDGMDRYMRWPEEMDMLLLNFLKQEKLKGNKDEKQFNKEAWTTVVTLLNEEWLKLGKKVDKIKVVNRLKTIQKLMNLAVELLDNKSGFGWNDVTKKIEATPSVWDSVVKSKSDYKQVRDKKLYFLEEARDLFEKDRAKGTNAESAREKIKRWQQEPLEDQYVGIDEIDEMQRTGEVFLQQVNSSSNSYNFNPVEQTQFGMTQELPSAQVNDSSMLRMEKTTFAGKRKRPLSNLITEQMKDVSAHMKRIADAIENTNIRVYSAKEIATELKNLGMGKWEVMDSVKFLKANEHLIELFFACEDDMKLAWLEKEMRDAEMD